MFLYQVLVHYYGGHMDVSQIVQGVDVSHDSQPVPCKPRLYFGLAAYRGIDA
jgi:hypothetical protein